MNCKPGQATIPASHPKTRFETKIPRELTPRKSFAPFLRIYLHRGTSAGGPQGTWTSEPRSARTQTSPPGFLWSDMPKRLLLADDHGLMLEGLARLLGAEFEV